MNLTHFLAHLFFPRESNNQRAKILHNSTLAVFIILFLVFQFGLSYTTKLEPKILGYASQISADEVIRLTNERRQNMGLLPLNKNEVLSQAALSKGTDMLSKDYWAHVSPDGVEPWKFFKDFGYKYRYAGENLARDFSNPSSVVNAWIESPTHRDNLLSPKYRDVGVAVVEGDLAGVDTTIVVQFFGSKSVDIIQIQPVAAAFPTTPKPNPITNKVAISKETQELTKGISIANKAPLISPFNFSQKFSLTLVSLLLGVLMIDGIVAFRQKIVRISGKNFAHISFLGMILAILVIAHAGSIL